MRKQKEQRFEVAGSDWTPLSRTIFECFEQDENKAETVRLPYRSAHGPKTIKINKTAQTFSFIFSDGSMFEGKPWQLLYHDEFLPQNAFAAALVHESAKAIWEQMNLNFARKVSEGTVSVFARFDSFRAPFALITSDQWPIYTVTNWETGAATAVDGTLIYSVHGMIGAEQIARAGRKPTYSQDQINGAVLRKIKEKGFPDPDGEKGWQGRADVERLIADFLVKIGHQEPARSTLQKQAKKALAAAKASQTGN